MKFVNVVFFDKLWHVKSTQDKIFLIYDYELDHENKIKFINDISINKPPIGYIQIYIQDYNIKVSNIFFNSVILARKFLILFKNFLILSIKHSPFNFILYWSKKIFTQELINIIKSINLLSDHNNRSCDLKKII
jgi:hypothetical protein